MTTGGSNLEVTHEVAQFAATVDAEQLPKQLVDTYASLLIDTVACGIAAHSTTAADQLMRAIAPMGSGNCSLVGRAQKVSASAAALYNGAMSHSLNFSALGPSNSHVGAVVCGGIFAAADSEGGVSGADLLSGVIAAAEVVTRLSEGLAASSTVGTVREKWLLGQLFGYAGVAAGCSRVLGLSAAQTQSAIGLAMMQASGTMEVVRLGDVPAKSLYAGFPNLSGLVSCYMAREGVVADHAAFDGAFGLFPLVLGVDDFDQGCLASLGQAFHSGRVHMKKWPVSVNVARYISALDRNLEWRGLPIDSISRIVIACLDADLTWLEPSEIRANPSTVAAAANSIQFSVATYLISLTIPIGAQAEEQLFGAEVRFLASKIDYVVGEQGRDLTIEYTSGERVVMNVKSVLFGPASTADSWQKFTDCANAAGGVRDDDLLVEARELFDDLVRVDNTSDLLPMLTRCALGASQPTL